MLKNKIISIFKKIHKKDKEFTERFLGKTPFSSSFWARRSLSSNIEDVSAYVDGIILDAGCGNKPYEKFFRNGAVRYIGVDYSSKSGYMGNKADVYADIRRLPFREGSFDAILCFEVLEHIDDVAMLMSGFESSLKKGGRLLISCPFAFPVHSSGLDYRRFTARGIEYVITKHNLKILKTVPLCNSACTLAVLLNTYIYETCFFWNTFMYPLSIIIRPLLWILIFLINMVCGILDKIFDAKSLPFGHLVTAEKRI